jgi:hypothetical protein
MKKIDVLWRLFVDCNTNVEPWRVQTQFNEIFKHGGMEALAKYVITTMWVYEVDNYPKDCDYLRKMMKELWETGVWPKDEE